jgi:ferredoxin
MNIQKDGYKAIRISNIPVSNKSTILEIIEQAKIEGVSVNSECRAGYCGACRCKVKGVGVEVEQNLDAMGYTDDDEVLACSSKPVGEEFTLYIPK